MDEQQHKLLLKHFSQCIQERVGGERASCSSSGAAPPQQKRFHWRVAPTAIVYFRRFYGVYSLLDHDPHVILLAAVLLAGKTEENRIPVSILQELLENFKCSSEDIQAAELLLLEALRFELIVEHPKSMVGTFIADLKHLPGNKSGGSSSSSSGSGSRGWSAAAEQILLDLQLTDAALRHSSVVLAICALRECQAVAGDSFAMSLDAYLSERFGADAAAVLLAEATAVSALLVEVRVAVDPQALRQALEWAKSNSAWGKRGK